MRRWLLAMALPLTIAAAATERDEFGYSYPAAVRAIPALKARLDGEAARLRVRFTRDAAADRQESRADGRTFIAWQLSRSWAVVTETPRFLSLSMEEYSFTGGAHGNAGFDSLVWDKAAHRALKPVAVFAGRAGLRAAIRQPFCAALDRQRAEKRGEAVNRAGGDIFDACIDPTENTVILGSSDRRRIDRIGVLIAPYAAGPYVEGTYEVTLPVTPAVFAAVAPAYRPYFAIAR